MLPVVEDDLRGDDGLVGALAVELAAAVQVAVPVREVRAGHVEAEPGAGGHRGGDRSQPDPVAVDAAGLEQRRLGERVAVARSDDALREVDRQAVGVDEGTLWGDYFYLEALTRATRPGWVSPW